MSRSRFKLAPQIAATLILTSLGACARQGSCCDDTDSSEVVITRDQLPAAVARTLDRESQGGKVGDIEKGLKDGRTVYSADIALGDKAYDLTIAEDGTLLGRELETDTSEKK